MGSADATMVSVCLPVHDPDSRQLEQALRSIEAQTRPPDEVVVSDDCSSIPVAEDFLKRFYSGRIRLVRQDRNLGMVGNWNAAVRESAGDLVVVAHQDDMLSPRMIERYLDAIADGDVLCSSNENVVDEEGLSIVEGGVNRRRNIYRSSPYYRLDHADLVRLCLRNFQAYGEPTAVMFRRYVFDRIGGYSDSYEHSADVDFVLRASRHGAALYLRDQLVTRRVHGTNLTRSHISSGASGRDRVRLWDDHIADAAASRRALHLIRVSLAAHAFNDLVRAARSHSWGVAREAAATFMRFVWAWPDAWVLQVVELASGRNLDRR